MAARTKVETPAAKKRNAHWQRWRLMNIRADVAEILDQGVDPATGEIAEWALSQLARSEEGRNEALLQLGRVVLEERARAEAIAGEVERLGRRRATCLANVERCLTAIGESLPDEPLADEVVKLRWHPSEAVMVDDMALLPDEAVKVTVSKAADRALLRKLIKAAEAKGEAVPGARIEKRKSVVVA